MRTTTRRWMVSVAVLSALAVFFVPGPTPAEQLAIGDGSGWHFVASSWHDGADGTIVGQRTGDGAGLQGYSLAFDKRKAYSDLEAEMTISMPTNHADVGLIVRAQDPNHYYLVHFPQSGQSFRAQHFWAAVSKADGSGYLRILKMVHVPRVASNPFGIPHKAKVKVEGDRIRVWLNGHPAIDVRDDTYKSGRVGLAGFAAWGHGRVTIDGTEVDAEPFDDSILQPKNWFHPFAEQGGRQSGMNLAHAPNGDLLCSFSNGQQRFLARSKDKGRTWAVGDVPAALTAAMPDDVNYALDLRTLADGRLIAVGVSSDGGIWAESKDNGKTFENVTPINTDNWPKDPEKIVTGWMIELDDGTLVRFGLGAHSSSTHPITQWGAVHCQAFSLRSTDGGRTWSAPVNLDANTRDDMGSLDLTEPMGFQKRDGGIMVLIRPIYSPWMWETHSSDAAESWGPCVRGPFPGYAPSTPLRTESGLVMFPTRFPGLTMHTTRDDGMTWDDGGGGTYIDTSIWAMGSLIEVEPNLVLHIYMDSWQGLARAQFIRVTPEGLMPARDMLPK